MGARAVLCSCTSGSSPSRAVRGGGTLSSQLLGGHLGALCCSSACPVHALQGASSCPCLKHCGAHDSHLVSEQE